jgi:hypothetical protein
MTDDETGEEIDTTNWWHVGRRGDGTVVVGNPPGLPMAVDKALVLAAWLVAVADPADERWPAVLEAVRGT